MTIGDTTFNLAISYTADGTAFVTVSQSILASLKASQSLQFALAYSDPSNGTICYTPELFSDPLAQ